MSGSRRRPYGLLGAKNGMDAGPESHPGPGAPESGVGIEPTGAPFPASPAAFETRERHQPPGPVGGIPTRLQHAGLRLRLVASIGFDPIAGHAASTRRAEPTLEPPPKSAQPRHGRLRRHLFEQGNLFE